MYHVRVGFCKHLNSDQNGEHKRTQGKAVIKGRRQKLGLEKGVRRRRKRGKRKERRTEWN